MNNFSRIASVKVYIYSKVSWLDFHKNQFLLGILAIIVMIFMIIIFVSSFKKWYELAKIKSLTTDKYGELVKAVIEE